MRLHDVDQLDDVVGAVAEVDAGVFLDQIERLPGQAADRPVERVTGADPLGDALLEPVGQLLQLAEAERAGSTDYFQFTSLINRAYTPEQKVKLIEVLWRVAYADEHGLALLKHAQQRRLHSLAQIGDLVEVAELVDRAHQVLGVALLDIAAGDVDVLRGKSARDLLKRVTERGDLVFVDIDMNFLFSRPMPCSPATLPWRATAFSANFV